MVGLFGWLALEPYRGPEIPRAEYESLEFTNYPTDPSTFFAPITSASIAMTGSGKQAVRRTKARCDR